MSSKIFEEKPAAGQAPVQQMGGEKAKIEKQARQLAYDTRYQVKKEVGDKKINPAIVKQLFIKQLAKSTAAPSIKARAKQMLLGEDYISGVENIAYDSLANAMFKVFVEGVQKEAEKIELNYIKELAENPDKKYKVRVTDKKTGNSYVRYATREKITQLRANPNIQSVEMTEYGDPREGERSRGESTAKAKSGRGLDPVGKEDADVDNDGKKNDPNDKYLMKRRKAIGNSIATRKESLDPVGKEDDDIDNDGKKNTKSDKYLKHRRNVRGSAISTRKEEFIADAADSSGKKITGKGVDNYAGGKNSVVKIFPEDGQDKVDRSGQTSSHGSMGIMAGYEVEGELIAEKAVSTSQQKFMGMVYAAKKGAKAASPEVAKAAAGMSEKEAKKFAKTKHKGLPAHVKEASECGSGDEDKRDQYAKKEIIKNKLRSALGVKNPIIMTAGYELNGNTISEREFDEPGEEDWRPDVRAHNKAAGYNPYRYKGYRRKPKPENPGPGSQAKPAD